MTLNIYSIFQSVNGEVGFSGMGSMCTFIRLAGCSADCHFCDTEYAKNPNSGKQMTYNEILAVIKEIGCNRITITGGEPFEQRDNLQEFLDFLFDEELPLNITIETNGLHRFYKNNISTWSGVNFVVDSKPTGPAYLNIIEGMKLTEDDYIKMVVGNKTEFHDAVSRKNYLQNHKCRATFAFSPEYGKVEPNELLQWMIEYKQTDAMLNVQLHKVLELVEHD
jgi:7-carboxy-7-deazaguanine synthase